MKYYDIPEQHINAKREKHLTNIHVKSKRLAVDDLIGAFKEDSLLGVTYQSNYLSTNNWWQTNNIGARSRKNTSPDIPLGTKRILAFGESFTNCRGVPQEETWPNYLEQSLDNTEVLNFGVNGYSTAQSYLRFQSITSDIDYDIVLFTFLPMDFIREVNIANCLVRWIGCRPTPRFILKEDRLSLIKIPYIDRKGYYEENSEYFSEKYLEHLRTYDRYYFPSKYEDTPILGKFVLYKIFSAAFVELKTKWLNGSHIEPKSEAFQITKRIFEEINGRANQDNKEFKLVILPSPEDISRHESSGSFKRKWGTLVSEMCTDQLNCLDLMGPLSILSPELMDSSYDRSHYGPLMNQVIAREIKFFLHKK